MSFESLPASSPDPLLAIIEQVVADSRENKLDLSIGVYRDEQGRTCVLDSVKRAERLLIESQDSKSYLGPAGDARYSELLANMIFGDPPGVVVRGLQAPGGTGALRIAADILALEKSRRIWVGLPTWSNHLPIFAAAKIECCTFEQFDLESQVIDFDKMINHLKGARPGDAVLLQGCCHNPTGIDLAPSDWTVLAEFMAQRRLVPLIDMAYHGLGQGLEFDTRMLREIVSHNPTSMVAYSCNKNFALYRDRVGAFFVASRSASVAERVIGNGQATVRSSYSMPPDHGAAVVRIILSDTELRSLWERELESMRLRIRAVRHAIGACVEGSLGGMKHISRQQGMFSTIQLDRAKVEMLRERHAVYVAPNGRVNLAGLPLANVGAFVSAVNEVMC